MATLIFDTIDDGQIAFTEEKGRLTKLTRPAKVTGLVSTDAVAMAAEVLDATNMPAAGAQIIVGGSRLVLVGRNFSRHPQDKSSGSVMLEYEREGSDDEESTPTVSRSGSSGLRQIRRVTDRDGNRLTVTYNSESKGAEMTVLAPEVIPQYETIESTNSPEELARDWVGYVNSAAWKGGAAGQYICAGADWEEYDTTSTTNKWRFRWSFQQAEGDEGWLPILAYVDPETNQVPEDASTGNGIEAVPYYLEKNFNTKFN